MIRIKVARTFNASDTGRPLALLELLPGPISRTHFLLPGEKVP